jgi:hypothetical protein
LFDFVGESILRIIFFTPIDNATKEAAPIPVHFKQGSASVMIGQ